MDGEKLTQAKRAVAIALRNMAEHSYFQLIAFESDAHHYAPQPVRYSQQQLVLADQWIHNLDAMGGTEIYQPLYDVLERKDKKQDSSRERIILLFTDGEVGNEDVIIQLVKKHKHRIRLFPFGIDTAVNASLIEKLAEHGNGVPEYVYPGERIEDKVTRQFARIHQQALEHPEFVDAVGNPIEVVPVLPERLYYADAYKFWLRESYVHHVELRGVLNGRPYHQVIRNGGRGDARLLSLAWAKATIKQWEERIETASHPHEREQMYHELVDVSARYGVLSSATALFAVHRRDRKPGTPMPETIIIPVAMPTGWGNDSEDEVVHMNMTRNDSMFELDSSAYIPADMDQAVQNRQAPRMSAVQVTMWDAASHQQADGRYGSGTRGEIHTAMFIIAMLLLPKHWRTYKVQIIKAADSLLKTANDTDASPAAHPSNLLRVIAYAQLIRLKVMPSAARQTIEQQRNRLTSMLTPQEQTAVEQMLRGEHQPWLKLAGIAGMTGAHLKTEDIATTLFHQVAQSSE